MARNILDGAERAGLVRFGQVNATQFHKFERVRDMARLDGCGRTSSSTPGTGPSAATRAAAARLACVLPCRFHPADWHGTPHNGQLHGKEGGVVLNSSGSSRFSSSMEAKDGCLLDARERVVLPAFPSCGKLGGSVGWLRAARAAAAAFSALANRSTFARTCSVTSTCGSKREYYFVVGGVNPPNKSSIPELPKCKKFSRGLSSGYCNGARPAVGRTPHPIG